MNEKTWKLRRLCVMALLSAMAFVVMAFIRIPVVAFLKYEPKDVLLVIGGFLFGPLAGSAMCVLVALVEMITVSDTGVIGLGMNILSSCLFVCVASGIYHRGKKLSGAILGLGCGTLAMAAGMMLWNYLITPLYMHVERQAVAGMLLPVFLPFNLLKGCLNAALAMLLYKGISTALRSARLLPPTPAKQQETKHFVWIAALFVLLSLTGVMLVWSGII